MGKEQIVLPKEHFKKRIKHQYANIPLAIAREIIQNSQDAEASRVVFTVTGTGFVAEDDGHGMTLDGFRQYYLTLGGTKKETGSIGGFGAAKELLSFAWDSWHCKGQGFTVTGSGAATPESDTTKGRARGFAVGARDDDLDGYAIGNELSRVVGLSNLDVDVFVAIDDGRPAEVKQGRTLRSNQVVREFEFGTLYVHKSTPRAFEETGTLYIRTKGLYTAEEYVGGDYVYYLCLESASPEVLTENRDGLRYDVKKRVQRELQAISRNPGSMETKAYPKLTVYGAYYTGSTYTHEVGSFDVDGIDPSETNLWRKPFAIANETGKPVKVETTTGNPRPSFTKALEIWSTTLNMIADLAGLHRPLPGLYFGTIAVAMCGKLGDGHVVVAQVDLMDADPFEIVETAMHELAHYSRQNHSQEYESARMAIASKVGSNVVAILDTIRRMQNEPAQRGRYWET